MGCCLSHSTTTKPTPTPTPHPKLQNNPTSCRRHPRPPPPPLEEETVKEVLTETPIAVFDGKPDERIQAKEEQVEIVEVKKQRGHGIEAVESKSVDVEVSEITVATENRSAAAVSVSVSVSESVSVGGEEVMSKSRDRAEAHVSRRQRTTSTTEQSPAKVTRRRPYSGELTVNGPREMRVRSPAKKAVPSPDKKTHVAPRVVRGRSQSPATSNNRNAVNAGPARIRRDAGERSGRRSRSPARNAFQTSSSRNVPSSEVNGVVNNGQSSHGEVRKTGTVEEEEGCPAADESLDNPLVSLECFIFL
ncbi:unnamed protein product [Rhodiola kirilowii]